VSQGMKIGLIICLILVVIVAVAIGSRMGKEKGENEPKAEPELVSGIVGNDAVGLPLSGDEKVEKLQYDYAGTAIGDIYTYRVFQEEGEVKLEISYMNINDENPDVFVLDADVLEQIMALIQKHGANNWNGYRKTDQDVLDGDSFHVSIKLSGKKEIYFSGSNCAPEGYYGFEKELLGLFEEYSIEVKEKYGL